jgi:cation diffusion facilitator family transporter
VTEHHDHGAGAGHGHGHGAREHGAHEHEHARGPRRIPHAVRPHSHGFADKADPALRASAEGLRALWVSFAVLAATAAVQGVVVVASGSAALLGDCLHNVADALTAVPLAVAFLLGRRPPSRRYTYGFGRAEDLAGIVVVATIAVSAVLAVAFSLRRLADPHEVTDLLAVAGAALVGFAGNEWVARYRIAVGRRIGSAALVADGLHARADGFTSLAVLGSAAAVAMGVPLADPVVGLAIGAAIGVVLVQAAREVYGRLMDAVDPRLVDQAEAALRGVPGVAGLGAVRLRWVGHDLRAEAEIVVDAALSLTAAHGIAVAAEQALVRSVPRLTAATVHADPDTAAGAHHHGHGALPQG